MRRYCIHDPNTLDPKWTHGVPLLHISAYFEASEEEFERIANLEVGSEILFDGCITIRRTE